MADEQTPDSPGLHIDADWKKQAQEEKRRLAEEAQRQKEAAAQQAASGQAGAPGAAPGAAAEAAQAGQRGERGQIPPADFTTLVSQTVTQAMFALGMIPDPETGRRVAMLDLARFHIDMLSVLEDKTGGNLSDEEQRLLASSLYELRMQYVQLSQQAIAEQTGAGDDAGQGAGGAGGILGG